MSDMLTHWAVFEDVRRLTQLDEKIADVFKNILYREREYARLGALTRGGKYWAKEIIEYAMKNKTELSQENSTERKKIAFALGGLTHYAADIVMKKICGNIAQQNWNQVHHAMQRGDDEEAAKIKEISAYYDVYVFRKVYLEGHEEPFNTFLLSHNNTQPGMALEEFIRALFQRALLASHTFAPERENYIGYIEKLISKVQRLYIDINLYCDIFSNPDENKMKEFRVRDLFYREDEPLIKIARMLQKNINELDYDEYEKAVIVDNNRCGYASALAISIQRIRELSLYWNGESNQFPDLKQ